jgi:hypothetical protein
VSLHVIARLLGIRVAWMVDGDHSFKPRKTSGRTEQQNWEASLSEIVIFLEGLSDGKEGKRREKTR